MGAEKIEPVADPHEAQITALHQQIDHYGNEDGLTFLSPEGQMVLQKKIRTYKSEHTDNVIAYCSKKKLDVPTDTIILHQFFRQQFINYLIKIDKDIPDLAAKLVSERAKRPEVATISLEELINKEGEELYKLALEEEKNSIHYLTHVVQKATSIENGQKWKQRPVLIVSGPSGCGKTYIAGKAMKIAQNYLSKDLTQPKTDNPVIAIDGGIARDVSQMRKLVIQVANNHGYSGVVDLQKQSKPLETVKSTLLAAAIKSPEVGITIPDTFSQWRIPGNKGLKTLKDIEALDNTKLIFTRIEGAVPSLFQKVVAFMGSRRAWKTDNFGKKQLNLNAEKLCESKAYNGRWFTAGASGSKAAEEWIQKHSKDKLHIVITNDLMLIKPEDASAGNEAWSIAEPNDVGARLVSARAYEEWKTLTSKKIGSLQECIERTEPLMLTSTQLYFADVKQQVTKRLEQVNKQIEQEYDKQYSGKKINFERIRYLGQKQLFLAQINHIDPRSLTSIEHIEKAQGLLHAFNAMLLKQKEGSWMRRFFSKSLKVIANVDKELVKMKEEMQLAQQMEEPLEKNTRTSFMQFKSFFSCLKPKSDESKPTIQPP